VREERPGELVSRDMHMPPIWNPADILSLLQEVQRGMIVNLGALHRITTLLKAYPPGIFGDGPKHLDEISRDLKALLDRVDMVSQEMSGREGAA
jgi:hypothetical protein